MKYKKIINPRLIHDHSIQQGSFIKNTKNLAVEMKNFDLSCLLISKTEMKFMKSEFTLL